MTNIVKPFSNLYAHIRENHESQQLLFNHIGPYSDQSHSYCIKTDDILRIESQTRIIIL